MDREAMENFMCKRELLMTTHMFQERVHQADL